MQIFKKKFLYFSGQLKVCSILLFSIMKDNELQQAREILDRLKFRVINILWNDSQLKHNSAYILFPWLQEEAEYAIKDLKLSQEDEQYFISKIKQIIGEYMEDI